jgi:hypothetical protein
MSARQSISDSLARSTVRLDVEAGGEHRAGTGFFFQFTTPEGPVPALVANNRLVQGARLGRLHLPAAAGHRATAPLVIEDFESHWIPHPDPKIDLCVLPLTTLAYQASRAGVPLRHSVIDRQLIPGDVELQSLAQVEEVLVLSYPAALRDSAHGQPVARRAITATHPALPWNGSPEFLVDVPCPPGTPGAPVFLFNLGGYETKSGGVRFGGIRVRLLGVLYGSPRPAAQAGDSAAPGTLVSLALAVSARNLLSFESALPDSDAAAALSSA